MNNSTHASRIVAAVLLAASLALVTPVLSGCGMIENIVENATGGDVESGTSVPSDFPSEVPLIHGDVLAGGSVGNADGKIWNVTIKVNDGSAFDEIKAQMEDAGFESSEVSGTSAEGGTGSFTKDPYGVFVVVTGGDTSEGWVANYTVTTSTK